MEDIGGFDACITSWGSPKFTSEVLERASKLRFIGHAAGTVIPIVDESIFNKGIIVANANSALAKSTAEVTVALMLAGSWDMHGFIVQMKEGLWRNRKETVMGLYGQTVGLIGCGDISKEVIRLIKPFHPRILMYSSYCPAKEAEELGVELCSLEELLKNSSIISLHNTLTPSTKGMLGRKELQLIQDGALLVNTSRGPIIDEKALVEELEKQRIYAALDVYETEPLPKEHPLLKLPNVLCMPHIGSFSSYWKKRLALTVIEDMERYIKGEPLKEEISAEKYRRMTPR